MKNTHTEPTLLFLAMIQYLVKLLHSDLHDCENSIYETPTHTVEQKEIIHFSFSSVRRQKGLTGNCLSI